MAILHPVFRVVFAWYLLVATALLTLLLPLQASAQAVQEAQVSVALTLLTPSSAPAGSTVQYQVAVSNTGPDAAEGVRIIDSVPSALVSVSWMCSTSAGGRCESTNGSGNSINVGVDVPANGTATLVISGTAPSATPATIPAHTAALVLPDSVTDPDTADNRSTAPSVEVQPLTLTANNDTFTTPISSVNGGTTPSVLTNDVLDGRPVQAANLSVRLVSAPAGYRITASGVVEVPAGAAAGAQQVTYQICETASPANCTSADASLIVAPRATDDSFNVNGGALHFTGNLALNDSAPNGATFSVTGGVVPGLVVAPTGGAFTYAPPGGINVPFTFQYQVCLPSPNATVCSVATAHLVLDANPLLIANDSLGRVPGSGGSTLTGVLVNDQFAGGPVPLGGQVTLELLAAPAGFSINLAANGIISAQPGMASGVYTLRYRVCESTFPTNCASATARVVVDPTAADVPVTTPGNDRAISGSLAFASNAPAGSLYSTVAGGGAAHGDVVMMSDGAFTYTPTAGYSGADAFAYQVCLAAPDAAACGQAQVRVTVPQTLYDAPIVGGLSPRTGPRAGGNTVQITGANFVPGSGTVSVLFGGIPVTATVVSPERITVQAPSGTDAVNVQVVAAGGASAASSASQYVYLPPPPVVSDMSISPARYNTGDNPVLVFSLAPYVTNAPTGFAVGAPVTSNGGTVSVNASGIVQYIAAVGFRGNDSFTYTASNAGGTSNVATALVYVENPTVTATLNGSGRAGSALSGVGLTVAGGRAPYTCASTLAAGQLPAGVQLATDCTLTGTPTQAGSFTFSATITDSSSTPFAATVQGLVLSISGSEPGAPTMGTATVSGPGAVTVTFTAPVSDGGSPISLYTVAANPGGARATGAGSPITVSGLTPGTAYSFHVTATNVHGESLRSALSNMVTPAESVVAQPVTVSVAAGVTAAPIPLSVTGIPTAVVVVSPPAHGTTVVDGLRILYTPSAGYAGTDSFTYSANDAFTTSPPALVNITVTAPTVVLDTPALPDTEGTQDYNQRLAASGGTAPYRMVVQSGALPPGLVLSEEGEITGAPTTAGTFAFTVKVTDANGFSGTRDYTMVVRSEQQAITDFVATPQDLVFSEGGRFALSARGGASGNPVVFATRTEAVCQVQGAEVTMRAAGRCTLSADQAGNALYEAAAQVLLNVDIALATPEIQWQSDLNRMLGEADFELEQPQSNSPGSFSFTSSAPSVATLNGRMVSLVGAGTAVITATQAASGNFAAASVQLTLTVAARPDPTTDRDVVSTLQAQVDASVRFAQTQQANIRDRLRHVRSGTNTSSFNVALASLGGQHGGVSVPLDQAASSTLNTLPQLPAGWGAWAGGTATFGSSGRNSRGFDFNTGGLSVGADRAWGERVLLGMAVSWGRQSTDATDSPSRTEADQHSLALYGLWRASEHVFVDAMIASGRMDFDLDRWSELAGTAAQARRTGDQVFCSLTFGYEHRTAGGSSVTGYGRYDGQRSQLDAYREHGLGALDLQYGRQDVDSSAWAIGLEGTHAFQGERLGWRPHWNVEYRTALDNQGHATLNYVQRPLANDYVLAMRSYNDDTLSIGAGVDLQFDRGWLISLLLGHEQGRNALRSNSIGVRVSWRGEGAGAGAR